MDKVSLEDAIRQEAEQAIHDISLKESEEIRKLDDLYKTEMEKFRNEIQSRTDARIRQESLKAENRTLLEIKKLRLRNLETFINKTVEETMKDIGSHSDYKRFLLSSITEAASCITEAFEVRLKSEDMVFEKEIMERLTASGKVSNAAITGGSEIRWGGCIVVDRSGGRIFDSSIERIYFRKSPQIHWEIMKMLGDYS